RLPILVPVADERQREAATGVVVPPEQPHAEDVAVEVKRAIEVPDPDHRVEDSHGRQHCAAQKRPSAAAASAGSSYGHQCPHPSNSRSSPRTRAASRSANRGATYGSSRDQSTSAGRVTRSTSGCHSAPTWIAER